MKSGVYRIINTSNGHYYIGSGVNVIKRRNDHFYRLRNKKHYNDYLQKAFNKYGEESFVFDIIEYCDITALIAREQFYIDSYKSQGLVLYNLCPIAFSVLNRPVSQKTRQKISNSLKGHIISEATKIKISNSPGVRKMKGIPFTEERKLAMSKLRKGKSNGREGKHHTEETRQKIALANTGKKLSPESIKKRTETRRSNRLRRKVYV